MAQSRSPLRAAVVGGSLGGLTMAGLLRDLDADVHVYERSGAQLESRGAGIVVHPTTVRYLEERGRLSLDEISTHARRLLYLGESGDVVYEEPCVWSFTAWNTLYRSLRGCFDDSRYHLGEAMSGFDQDESEVELRLHSGEQLRCDLLVGADGIASTTRSLLLPAAQPEYAGYVGWRGTVEESQLTAATHGVVGEAIVYHLMPRSHILTYPIPAVSGSVLPGRRLINFVWYRNVAEGTPLDDLMTDRNGFRQPLSLPPGAIRDGPLAEFRQAAAALPECLAETVLKTEQPFVQPIVDLEVPRMAFGRVCLIGDAAFVARPHAAAGTAKAAADAWALADALEAARDHVPQALNRWEPGRLKFGRQLLERVRDVGDRSQFGAGWQPDNPSLRWLWAPGR